jgi:acylglycerol lipase
MAEEGWFQSDKELYTRTWTPTGKVKASVCFIHGFGEHCKRYDNLFKVFKDNGIKVKAYDQRGGYIKLI